MIYVIKAFFGGLGDSLQFTTIPEMLTNAGHEVYLAADAPFRNPAIKPFVWGKNPFIKGESSGEWNAGDIHGRVYVNKYNDYIKNWEWIHGLEPTNSLPQIYYQPKKVDNKFGIIELSCLSLHYDNSKVIKMVQQIIAGLGIDFVQLQSPHQLNQHYVPGLPVVQISGLEELSDIIHSCSSLITLNSGTHSLAAAIRRFGNPVDHYCLLPEKDYGWIMEGKRFVFPGINYIKC
ncbi:MAG: hypothetical protein UV51_C0007G0005 [Candidatus Woesebacteria bacterium GW2011_GWC1_42_9]|nr:MAG: hypothetical protein UV51_C0007G0005 [Candidatus Woesebacteria bacterium GW2011_GWC1_42_9]